MWIFTEFGFFSIARLPGQESKTDLQVRARVKADLERFLQRHRERIRVRLDGCEEFPEIIESKDSDYRFRCILSESIVASILINEVMGIAYSNFKNRVAEVQGPHASFVYGRVWATARRLQFDMGNVVEGDVIDADFFFPEEEAEENS